jgi:sigma-B regulation protein RsbU (phosphoserine phosphatase)
MESVTGKRPVPAALLRGWRRRDWVGLLLGLVTLAIIAAADIALGVQEAVLVGAFVVAPFVCALFAHVPATLLVGAAALGLAAGSVAWHGELDTQPYRVALAVIAIGTPFALASAWSRQRSSVRGERLRILDAVATIADGSQPLDVALDRVTELVVPSVADICMIDAIHPGGVTRAAVRASGHRRAGEIERRLRAHPPSLPRWLTRHEPQWRQIPRWRPRMREEELRRMAGSERDFEFLRSLRIRSMLVVPIAARDRNLGALTLLSAWSRRHYREEDVRFAQIAARRIGLALDNAGLFSDLESVERRMDTVMSILDEAVLIHSRDGELVFANPAAARTLGFESAAELIARPEEIGERLTIRDESGAPLDLRALPGGSLHAEARGALIVRATDVRTRREAWLRARWQPIEGPGGHPLYSVTVIEDVTDVKRAEFAQGLLARTGELLASSLDYWRTLDEVAHLAVPEFADWCTVDVPAPGGRIEQVAIAHVDAERAGDLTEIRKGFGMLVNQPGGVAEVIRTGRPRLIGAGDELADEIAATDEELSRLAGASIGSAIIVPMVAGARVVGALTFANGPGARELDAGDLGIAVELGRRAGLATENARIAGERARIAATLERELLPPELPDMEGWEVATMYRAAGEMSEVGGDFYEAFSVGDEWAVILGDVSGHGPLAASLTGVARHTIRTATTLAADPAVGLRVLDERLRERDAVALCSVAVLLLPKGDPEGEIEARLWLAGHPRPFVLHDGVPREVGDPGPLVGIGEAPAWRSARVVLHPGDQLVVYTDGVTEARRPDGDRFGVERLRQRIASCEEPAATVARVEASVVRFSPGEPRDDATLVAIRRTSASSGDRVDRAATASDSATLVPET